MNLTDEERRKFAEYCTQEAKTYAGLAIEMEKLPMGIRIAVPIRTKAMAFAVVAQNLSNVETVEVRK